MCIYTYDDIIYICIKFGSLFHLKPIFSFLRVPQKPPFHVDVLFTEWNKNEFLLARAWSRAWHKKNSPTWGLLLPLVLLR